MSMCSHDKLRRIDKNFDTHFTNNVDEVIADDQQYEYYTDGRKYSNLIKINRKIAYHSNPVQYEVLINNSKTYLSDLEINNLIRSIDGIRIDEYAFASLSNKQKKN